MSLVDDGYKLLLSLANRTIESGIPRDVAPLMILGQSHCTAMLVKHSEKLRVLKLYPTETALVHLRNEAEMLKRLQCLSSTGIVPTVHLVNDNSLVISPVGVHFCS
jgi:hypothetical protein